MPIYNILFWICVSIVIAIAIIAIVGNIVASVKKPQEINNACAGSKHKGVSRFSQINQVAIDTLIHNVTKNNPIPGPFKPFVVKGNSMQYANINTGDIILAGKSEIRQIKTILPKVVVLKIADSKLNECGFKLRRAWEIVPRNISDNELSIIMDKVLDSFPFMELRHLTKSECPSNEVLKEEIIRKLKSRREENSNNSSYILSTTYRTEEKRISFSLHDIDSLEGIVYYSAPQNK